MIVRERALCLLGLMMIQSGLLVVKPKPVQVGNGNNRVERAEKRPDLASDFGEVAQLKIASRKTNFYLGEMMTLDIALLNISSRPMFFRKLSPLNINAVNSAGQTLAVQEYGVADRAVVPNSFIQLSPNEIIVRSFQLLAGCDQRAFAQIASNTSDGPTLFKNGLFLNWGDACLPNTATETYTVSVQIKNDLLLLAPRKGKVKTGVGTIKSNSLVVTIRK